MVQRRTTNWTWGSCGAAGLRETANNFGGGLRHAAKGLRKEKCPQHAKNEPDEPHADDEIAAARITLHIGGQPFQANCQRNGNAGEQVGCDWVLEGGMPEASTRLQPCDSNGPTAHRGDDKEPEFDAVSLGPWRSVGVGVDVAFGRIHAAGNFPEMLAGAGDRMIQQFQDAVNFFDVRIVDRAETVPSRLADAGLASPAAGKRLHAEGGLSISGSMIA